MAKFDVNIVTTVTKRALLQVDITRKRLEEEDLLEPGGDWKLEAESYIHENIEELIESGEAKLNGIPFDPNSNNWDIEEDSIYCDDVTYD